MAEKQVGRGGGSLSRNLVRGDPDPMRVKSLGGLTPLRPKQILIIKIQNEHAKTCSAAKLSICGFLTSLAGLIKNH